MLAVMAEASSMLPLSYLKTHDKDLKTAKIQVPYGDLYLFITVSLFLISTPTTNIPV